jgi:hypothetical protein
MLQIGSKQRGIWRDVVNGCLLTLLLTLVPLKISFAQAVGPASFSDIAAPNQAMERAVPRILGWYFRPSRRPKVIYLAGDDIRTSWLPHVKNIEFRLLSSEEVRQRDEEVYFFTAAESTGGSFRIGFAYGTPGCVHVGDTWQLRISKKRIRLWRDGGSIAGGCSRGMPQSNNGMHPTRISGDFMR